MQPDHQSASPSQRRKVDAIASCLAQCLRHLDAVDGGLAAVHVSMALDILKRDYRLDTQAGERPKDAPVSAR
jgi:hypothetical protein